MARRSVDSEARLAQLRQVRAVQDAAGAWSDEGRGEPSRAIREARQAWDLWLDEARRRDQEMDEGLVTGVSGNDVFARIRARFATSKPIQGGPGRCSEG